LIENLNSEGPGLLGRARPDLMSKFTALNKEENEDNVDGGDDKNKSRVALHPQ
jgi:hypothetical protein